MCKLIYTEEQIAYVLREAESGTLVLEVCRKLGISEQSFYRRKREFACMGSLNCGDCVNSRKRIVG